MLLDTQAINLGIWELSSWIESTQRMQDNCPLITDEVETSQTLLSAKIFLRK